MTLIDEDAVLRFAQLCADAIAMNDAAQASDFEEGPFRARWIFDVALEMGWNAVAQTASEIERLPGAPGTQPLP